ncbi:MAG: phosphotransferase [Desulfarculus sp.]|nr:phosphotransferase [Desulfarculus sp.]
MPEAQPSALAVWARSVWPGGDPGPLTAEAITPDGSIRRFLRLVANDSSLVAMANPDNPPENRAWLGLARHLGALGLPVARVVAVDLAGGRFLMEDLGRASLQQMALAAGDDQETLARLYEPVLAMLALMQSSAGRDLDASLCFDGLRLDGQFLFAREAGYFLTQFVTGACGLGPETWPANLVEELRELAHLAGRARPEGFTHRDFQSRNLIHQDGRVGLVDFQGGRLGPAQYDLASLVHDPYVDLPWELRQRLVERYLAIRASLGGLDPERFMAGWPYVALSRLMQALGAYAFLCREKGKTHFAPYVAPALATLRRLAAAPELASFPALGRLLELLPLNPPTAALRPREDNAA